MRRSTETRLGMAGQPLATEQEEREALIELAPHPQWVAWRIEPQDGRPTKVPYDPHTGRKASPTDPATWGTYAQARTFSEAQGMDGVGYVFSAEDPYTGIDLDKCRDAETGSIDEWAQEIITALRSYTEISPSGRGAHVIVRGKLPPEGRRKGRIELYDSGRYFTMTGMRLEGTPSSIEARAHEAPGTSRVTESLTDEEVLGKARGAKNGEKFDRLWTGDTSNYDDDDSGADMALCRLLAFWTQDPAQIDRLFRQSGLMRRKWDEMRGAQTYGERTIARALEYTVERYTSANGQQQYGADILLEGNSVGDGTTNGHSAPSGLRLYTAAELQRMELPEPRWVVPGLIVEGLTLLAGAPKIGKSWLALNLCLAVSRGTQALGKIGVEPATAVYLALEDNQARMRGRLDWLLGSNVLWPERLVATHHAPRVQAGLEEGFAEMPEEYPDIHLVIIDTFAKVRPAFQRGKPLYQEDYEIGEVLHTLALAHHVAILVLHHVSKRDTSDPLERVSGTTGLTGSADSTFVLERPRGLGNAPLFATLFVFGREVEEKVLSLSFKDGLWTLEGEAQETVSPIRSMILEVLAQADRPLTAKEVAEKLGMGDEKGRTNVRQTLSRMSRDGQITRLPGGGYILPSHSCHSVTGGISLSSVTDIQLAVSQGEVTEDQGKSEPQPPSVTGVTPMLAAIDPSSLN